MIGPDPERHRPSVRKGIIQLEAEAYVGRDRSTYRSIFPFVSSAIRLPPESRTELPLVAEAEGLIETHNGSALIQVQGYGSSEQLIGE